jgi:hypothetical protein
MELQRPEETGRTGIAMWDLGTAFHHLEHKDPSGPQLGARRRAWPQVSATNSNRAVAITGGDSGTYSGDSRRRSSAFNPRRALALQVN